MQPGFGDRGMNAALELKGSLLPLITTNLSNFSTSNKNERNQHFDLSAETFYVILKLNWLLKLAYHLHNCKLYFYYLLFSFHTKSHVVLTSNLLVPYLC